MTVCSGICRLEARTGVNAGGWHIDCGRMGEVFVSFVFEVNYENAF